MFLIGMGATRVDYSVCGLVCRWLASCASGCVQADGRLGLLGGLDLLCGLLAYYTLLDVYVVHAAHMGSGMGTSHVLQVHVPGT